MITGKDLEVLARTASNASSQIGLNYFDVYYEKLAELINAKFTGTATVQQEPLVSDIYEQLSNMPEQMQALVYGFLHRIGHRIYK